MLRRAESMQMARQKHAFCRLKAMLLALKTASEVALWCACTRKWLCRNDIRKCLMLAVFAGNGSSVCENVLDLEVRCQEKSRMRVGLILARPTLWMIFFTKKYNFTYILLPLRPENCFTMNKNSFIYRTFDLYYDGFKHMTIGKTLWVVILIKLFIMFAILKAFFFPDFIRQKAQKGKEADFVSTEMIKRNIH